MYRIRFHGRGGQGMKTAAQMLGSAFFVAGFEVQDAARYGAERRGAPIFAYVRAARTTIHERGVIARPDLAIVADDTLVPVPAAGVLQGLAERTVLLVNSAEPAATWQDRLKLAGPVLTLPVAAEVTDRADLPFIGATCAGAAARLVGVIARDALVQAIHAEVGERGATVLERNLAQALAAYDAMGPYAGVVREGADVGAHDYAPPEWIVVPAEDVSIAAPDIRGALTSERANTGLWRTLRPVIDYERCNRCSWICSTFCPDSAIKVDADHTPRIDYDHCKGCMVCATVCPPHAIRAVPERAKETA